MLIYPSNSGKVLLSLAVCAMVYQNFLPALLVVANSSKMHTTTLFKHLVTQRNFKLLCRNYYNSTIHLSVVFREAKSDLT